MIETRYARERDLTVQVCEGPQTAAALRQAIARWYADGPTRHVLWDLRRADVAALGVEQVAGLAEAVVDLSHSRDGGRTALLVGDALAHGLARAFESQVEIQGHAVPVQVFRDEAAARAWLQGEPT